MIFNILARYPNINYSEIDNKILSKEFDDKSLEKVKLESGTIGNMLKLWNENPKLFLEYSRKKIGMFFFFKKLRQNRGLVFFLTF